MKEQETDPDIQENAQSYLNKLTARSNEAAEKPCCEPTLACLESQVHNTSDVTASSAPSFANKGEVERYLQQWQQNEIAEPAPAAAARVQIDQNNALLGLAQTGAQTVQWRHWLGCWRKE